MTENIPTSTAPMRNPDGTWARGSGGRIKGTKNRVSRAAIERIQGLAGEAFEQLESALRRGERYAVELVLSKVLPAGRVLEIDASADGIRDHLANGDFSDQEARAVANILEKLEKLDRYEQLAAEVDQIRALLRQGSVDLS